MDMAVFVSGFQVYYSTKGYGTCIAKSVDFLFQDSNFSGRNNHSWNSKNFQIFGVFDPEAPLVWKDLWKWIIPFQLFNPNLLEKSSCHDQHWSDQTQRIENFCSFSQNDPFCQDFWVGKTAFWKRQLIGLDIPSHSKNLLGRHLDRVIILKEFVNNSGCPLFFFKGFQHSRWVWSEFSQIHPNLGINLVP